jgi:hypothetical protein
MGEDTSGVASCMFRVTRVDKSTWWGANRAVRVRRWKWGHARAVLCGGKGSVPQRGGCPTIKQWTRWGPPPARACLVRREVDVARVEDAVVVGV